MKSQEPELKHAEENRREAGLETGIVSGIQQRTGNKLIPPGSVLKGQSRQGKKEKNIDP